MTKFYTFDQNNSGGDDSNPGAWVPADQLIEARHRLAEVEAERDGLRAALAADHAETGHLDAPKERSLRLDLEQADAEVQVLKGLLARTRMVPLPEEVEAMFYWRKKALYYEELLDRFGMNPRERFDRLAALGDKP